MQLRKITHAIILTMLFFFIGYTHGFCADVAKIGTVNFQKIFNNSKAGQKVKEQINAEGQRMEADLKKLGDEIQTIKQTLENDAGVMTKEARDEKKWQYERKVDDVKALKQKYDRQIQELQRQLVNTVRKEVLKIIQDYGKKEGYLLIIEDLNTVYAPETLDVTDKVIQLYNAAYKKKK
jgi:outer membrane protein